MAGRAHRAEIAPVDAIVADRAEEVECCLKKCPLALGGYMLVGTQPRKMTTYAVVCQCCGKGKTLVTYSDPKVRIKVVPFR